MVIAIIAILAGMLLPRTFQGEVKGQRHPLCLKPEAMGIIWQLYTDDNGGKFSDGDVGWARGEWVVALAEHYQENPCCFSAQMPLTDVARVPPEAKSKTYRHP